MIATESHCITNESCHQATVATNEEELAAALTKWGYASDTVIANGNVFVIFGFTESGSCPNQIRDVAVANGTLEIEIPVIRSACTTDENERSYILELEAGTTVSNVNAGRTNLGLTS